jgi:hypothetical protein
MSRFDDEIRDASRQLAREAMPESLLDESLEPTGGWQAAGRRVGAAIGAVGLVLVVGWLAGRIGLPVAADGSPGIQPSSSAIASICEDIPRTGAYSLGLYRVFFPCADGSGLVSTWRIVGIPIQGEEELVASAVRDLLNGPNAQEQEAGMVPVAAPDGGRELLIGVDLQPDGLAVVDLSSKAADAKLMPAFREAVRATALALDAVTAVELRLAGDCGQFFALFGAPCDHLAEPLALTTDCPVVTPRALPDGDSVGAGLTAARPYPEQPNTVSWGSGGDTVTERIGQPGGDAFPVDGETMALPFLDGQASVDRAEFSWVDSGCPYFVSVPDRSGAFAQDYSTLFGSGTASQPSATPLPEAPYGNASTEADGIRITLRLDQTGTSFGERVWADVTVENIGSDVVHWGHSGSCAWPAGVQLTTDAVLPGYGAEWPGEAGILKRITIDDPDVWLFGFVPEAMVDFEGNWGCTSDLVPDEILPGERLSHRFAWDTVGINGMPPPGGRYVAESVFAYQGRGDVDGDADPFRKRVGVQVSLDVEGPSREYVSPGEAVDLLLADETFIQLLADNPRTQWNSSTLRWVAESWQLEIAQEVPYDPLVATVDAITGAVSGVEVRPRS